MLLRAASLCAVMASAAVVDTAWLSRLPLYGAPDILLLAVLSIGLRQGLDAGALVGAAAGYLRDLIGGSPMGLYALSYLLVGAAAGAAGPLVDLHQRAMSAAAAMVGTTLLAVLMAGAVVVTGVAPVRWLVVLYAVAVAAVLNALLAGPVDRLMRWIDRLARRRYEGRMIGHKVLR
jgi:rod shape-determining protein MreD